jgi:hypothetical protein
MANKTNRKITYPKGDGLFQDFLLRIKLILRLLADSRVNPVLKLLPIASVIYLVWPFDIPGPFDDAFMLWLASYLFVELCPPDIVQEHLDALKATRRVMDNYQQTSQTDGRGEVIDGEIVDGDVEAK